MTEGVIFPGVPKTVSPSVGRVVPPVGIPPTFIPSVKQVVVPPPPPVSREKESFFSKRIFRIGIGIIGILVTLFLLFFAFTHIINTKPEHVTLTYWGLWEDQPTMQAIIADFEKQNPNITITYKMNTVKDYRKKLVTQIQNGNGPDIFRIHNSWLPEMINYMSPLPSSVISREELQNSYYPVVSSDLVRNGAIYAVPMEIDTLSLFLNTDIFHAAGISAPSSWNDFQSAARTLTVKDDTGQIKTAGAALGTSGNVEHASDILSLLLVQNGVDLKNIGASSANASDALNFYTSFASGNNNVWDNTLEPSLQAFAGGKVAMYFGYSWDILTLKALNPTLSFQIVPVPHLPNKNMTIASYWAEGVSIKSKHQKEALKFLSYLSKKETEQKLFAESAKTRMFGEPYARIELAPLLADNQLLNPFVVQAKNAVSTPFSSDTSDQGMDDALNAYLYNAINAVLSSSSPQSAIDTLSLGTAQIFQQYGQ